MAGVSGGMTPDEASNFLKTHGLKEDGLKKTSGSTEWGKTKKTSNTGRDMRRAPRKKVRRQGKKMAMGEIVRNMVGEAAPRNGIHKSSSDIRKVADEKKEVKDGVIYRYGNKIQVWWVRDTLGRKFSPPQSETWTLPDIGQAKRNFKDMASRWNESVVTEAEKTPYGARQTDYHEKESQAHGEAKRMGFGKKGYYVAQTPLGWVAIEYANESVVIEAEKLSVQCQECGKKFKSSGSWNAKCPKCGSSDIDLAERLNEAGTKNFEVNAVGNGWSYSSIVNAPNQQAAEREFMKDVRFRRMARQNKQSIKDVELLTTPIKVGAWVGGAGGMKRKPGTSRSSYQKRWTNEGVEPHSLSHGGNIRVPTNPVKTDLGRGELTQQELDIIDSRWKEILAFAQRAFAGKPYAVAIRAIEKRLERAYNISNENSGTVAATVADILKKDYSPKSRAFQKVHPKTSKGAVSQGSGYIPMRYPPHHSMGAVKLGAHGNA